MALSHEITGYLTQQPMLAIGLAGLTNDQWMAVMRNVRPQLIDFVRHTDVWVQDKIVKLPRAEHEEQKLHF